MNKKVLEKGRETVKGKRERALAILSMLEEEYPEGPSVTLITKARSSSL